MKEDIKDIIKQIENIFSILDGRDKHVDSLNREIITNRNLNNQHTDKINEHDLEIIRMKRAIKELQEEREEPPEKETMYTPKRNVRKLIVDVLGDFGKATTQDIQSAENIDGKVVHNYLKKLEKEGYVEVVSERKNKDGGRPQKEYGLTDKEYVDEEEGYNNGD